jgi:hypothetical protein
MTNAKRLPLDSALWSRLEAVGIAPGRVPLILKKLMEEPVNPMDPALDELVSAIFHQYSLTDATYAVFPYLIAIYDRYSKTNPTLFYLAANIAASADIDQTHLPSEVHEAFMEGLVDFETIAISRIVTKAQPFADVYSACIAAMAFSRHCCGKLLMDGLEREGTRNTGLICQKCDEQIEVMLFPEGLVVIEPGRETQPPKPPKPLGRPLIRSYGVRQPNPWQVVYSFLLEESQPSRLSDTEPLHVEMATRLCAAGLGPNTPPEDAFSLLGSILLTHGYSSSARRFFHLWDEVACTKCECTFVAAKGWWGCAGNIGTDK